MVLSLQQRDVIHRPGCYQDGRFVVVERVSVVSDNDDFHVITSFQLYLSKFTGKNILHSPCISYCIVLKYRIDTAIRYVYTI